MKTAYSHERVKVQYMDRDQVDVPIGHLAIAVVDERDAGCTVALPWKDAKRMARDVWLISKKNAHLMRQSIPVLFSLYLSKPPCEETAIPLAISALAYALNHPDKVHRTAARKTIPATISRCKACCLDMLVRDGEIDLWVVTEPPERSGGTRH